MCLSTISWSSKYDHFVSKYDHGLPNTITHVSMYDQICTIYDQFTLNADGVRSVYDQFEKSASCVDLVNIFSKNDHFGLPSTFISEGLGFTRVKKFPPESGQQYI